VYRPQPFAAIYGVLLLTASAGAFGLYFLLLHIMHAASATLANKIDVAKTALLVVGGSGALAGLYVSYRKQRTDEASYVRDQDKLFTERYTAAAAAQLGHGKAAVRLAGVYALARIADDSERDRPTCLKVVCAYLRMPYDPDDPATDPAEREVRTTAQTVLAERLRPEHHGFWPDAHIDLTAACLINPDFGGIVVRVFAARSARFDGHAGFGGATFNGDAGFSKAMFGSATFVAARFGEDIRFGGVGGRLISVAVLSVEAFDSVVGFHAMSSPLTAPERAVAGGASVVNRSEQVATSRSISGTGSCPQTSAACSTT
jgi:hypothetical protein